MCLLFLLPGLILLKKYLPDKETVQEQKEGVRQTIEYIVDRAKKPKETSDEERQFLLDAGESCNGCSYYYWLLDEAGRVEYMKVLDGLMAMQEDIDLLLDEETAKKTVKMVFADHPELFWTNPSYNYTIYTNRIQVHPIYTCTAEEKEERSVKIEETVQEALQTIPDGAGVYEHMKALYTFVANTVSYDLEAPDNQNIYSSMVNRVSVCTGYAKELQYLLQRVGIQALLAEGEVTDRGPHAWLIACCDGNFYHLDPTFGDPSFTEESEEDLSSLPAEFQVDYSFLCCDDEEIFCDRTLSEELELPACTAKDLLYYPIHGRYFSSYGEDVLISIQESLERGEAFWEGQFADEESFALMISQMQDGVYANMVLENHPDMESVLCRMSYRTESYVVKMWY